MSKPSPPIQTQEPPKQPPVDPTIEQFLREVEQKSDFRLKQHENNLLHSQGENFQRIIELDEKTHQLMDNYYHQSIQSSSFLKTRQDYIKMETEGVMKRMEEVEGKLFELKKKQLDGLPDFDSYHYNTYHRDINNNNGKNNDLNLVSSNNNNTTTMLPLTYPPHDLNQTKVISNDILLNGNVMGSPYLDDNDNTIISKGFGNDKTTHNNSDNNNTISSQLQNITNNISSLISSHANRLYHDEKTIYTHTQVIDTNSPEYNQLIAKGSSYLNRKTPSTFSQPHLNINTTDSTHSHLNINNLDINHHNNTHIMNSNTHTTSSLTTTPQIASALASLPDINNDISSKWDQLTALPGEIMRGNIGNSDHTDGETSLLNNFTNPKSLLSSLQLYYSAAPTQLLSSDPLDEEKEGNVKVKMPPFHDYYKEKDYLAVLDILRSQYNILRSKEMNLINDYNQHNNGLENNFALLLKGHQGKINDIVRKQMGLYKDHSEAITSIITTGDDEIAHAQGLLDIERDGFAERIQEVRGKMKEIAERESANCQKLENEIKSLYDAHYVTRTLTNESKFIRRVLELNDRYGSTVEQYTKRLQAMEIMLDLDQVELLHLNRRRHHDLAILWDKKRKELLKKQMKYRVFDGNDNGIADNSFTIVGDGNIDHNNNNNNNNNDNDNDIFHNNQQNLNNSHSSLPPSIFSVAFHTWRNAAVDFITNRYPHLQTRLNTMINKAHLDIFPDSQSIIPFSPSSSSYTSTQMIENIVDTNRNNHTNNSNHTLLSSLTSHLNSHTTYPTTFIPPHFDSIIPITQYRHEHDGMGLDNVGEVMGDTIINLNHTNGDHDTLAITRKKPQSFYDDFGNKLRNYGSTGNGKINNLQGKAINYDYYDKIQSLVPPMVISVQSAIDNMNANHPNLPPRFEFLNDSSSSSSSSLFHSSKTSQLDPNSNKESSPNHFPTLQSILLHVKHTIQSGLDLDNNHESTKDQSSTNNNDNDNEKEKTSHYHSISQYEGDDVLTNQYYYKKHLHQNQPHYSHHNKHNIPYFYNNHLYSPTNYYNSTMNNHLNNDPTKLNDYRYVWYPNKYSFMTNLEQMTPKPVYNAMISMGQVLHNLLNHSTTFIPPSTSSQTSSFYSQSHSSTSTASKMPLPKDELYSILDNNIGDDNNDYNHNNRAHNTHSNTPQDDIIYNYNALGSLGYSKESTQTPQQIADSNNQSRFHLFSRSHNHSSHQPIDHSITGTKMGLFYRRFDQAMNLFDDNHDHGDKHDDYYHNDLSNHQIPTKY